MDDVEEDYKIEKKNRKAIDDIIIIAINNSFIHSSLLNMWRAMCLLFVDHCLMWNESKRFQVQESLLRSLLEWIGEVNGRPT